MKKIIIIIITNFFFSITFASYKSEIIMKLKETKNISFNFSQKIGTKNEKGKCIIEYPGKIFCNYNLANNKILVSNGKSLIIKTKSSYYKYPIARTPLKQILDKNFLINQIKI